MRYTLREKDPHVRYVFTQAVTDNGPMTMKVPLATLL